MTVRTRFAPSPTGLLHVGGARTALFAWLYAKKHQGSFVLRIEDTDRERSTEASVNAILEGMSWLGMEADEGPYYQTKRFDRYYEVIEQLLVSGHAYRCTCTRERLDELRDTQTKQKLKPRYDGHCRDKNLPAGEAPFVVRFKNPLDGDVVFDDQVYGTISISNRELDDLIIARSDGTPTYNLTVVVDDYDMKISHVIRGDDHINNTPRQINILKAMGADIPVYAHLPMILGDDQKRLSKRHGAVGVMEYYEQGYLPHALLNYLVRLGWSHGDQEIFSMEEMINNFSLKAIGKAASAFNTQKLLWLNQHYLKSDSADSVAEALKPHMEKLGLDLSQGPALEAIVQLQAERVKTLIEMAERSQYFYQPVTEYDDKAVKKNFSAAIIDPLQTVHDKLSQLSAWEEEPMHQVIIETAEHFDLKLGKLAQPIRVAVTGNTVSPSIDSTLFHLGRDRVLERLLNAIEFIKNL